MRPVAQRCPSVDRCTPPVGVVGVPWAAPGDTPPPCSGSAIPGAEVPTLGDTQSRTPPLAPLPSRQRRDPTGRPCSPAPTSDKVVHAGERPYSQRFRFAASATPNSRVGLIPTNHALVPTIAVASRFMPGRCLSGICARIVDWRRSRVLTRWNGWRPGCLLVFSVLLLVGPSGCGGNSADYDSYVKFYDGVSWFQRDSGPRYSERDFQSYADATCGQDTKAIAEQMSNERL